MVAFNFLDDVIIFQQLLIYDLMIEEVAVEVRCYHSMRKNKEPYTQVYLFKGLLVLLLQIFMFSFAPLLLLVFQPGQF